MGSWEFQVNGRRSFEKLVGLGVMDSISDATTVSLSRERLRRAGVTEEPFEMLDTSLKAQGLEAHGGQVIDATLVPVATQHHRQEENEDIQQGKVPQQWQSRPGKLGQKDLDAR